MKIPVVRNILEVNDRIAEEHRRLFQHYNLLVLNLMSSPGAGKTTLLENTIGELKKKMRVGVIEGDIQTSADAERIVQSGAVAVQINTDGACHLDANMIKVALPAMNLGEVDLLFIENVGNLVCPAEFDLGEDSKVMILSVTEGDDKPEKYPLMFHEASVLLINKIDLLPYVNFDMNRAREAVIRINPDIEIFEISCQTREGLDSWFQWILCHVKK
ncbi:MAG: hydrogenase nickel incorporation protein HypB [Thermodesulfobacteriota bacterium]|nr:hydrogenase nickel incorporation protein HypB [Thermodesulfobacteriota bacterium]